MMRPLRIVRGILSHLFPAACSYCRSRIDSSPVPHLCGDCWSDLAPVSGPVCPGCGRPFGSPEALNASPEHLCGSCVKDPPHFDQALAAGLFEGPLREAVHLYKYRPARSLGRPLAAWMTAQVRMISGLDQVMPVPLHRRRLRQRGFNQALLLANGVADVFGLRLVYDNLHRVRNTRPQVELSGEERARNVRNAFRLDRPAEVEGKRILLVDDVFTSGATMNECARVLKEEGAENVIVFTLARTCE
jgi:ComF family protein